MTDAIRQIINFLIRGYPLREMRGDVLDIQNKHKVTRNIFRLIAATGGIAIGIIGPNLIAPGINIYLSNILIKILPINLSSLNLTILATFFCMWVSTSIALWLSKQVFRGYFYCKHRVTNSSHYLTPRKTQLIAMSLKNHLIFFSPDIENILSKLSNDEYFVDRVKNDFNCMIDEVKRLKKIIKYNNHSAQQQEEHANQKKDLKAILKAYLKSDFNPYDEYLKLYEAKRKTNQDRLLVLRQNKAKFRLLNERINAHHQIGSQSLEIEFSFSSSHGPNNDYPQSILVQNDAANHSEIGSPEVSHTGVVTPIESSMLESQSKLYQEINSSKIRKGEIKQAIELAPSSSLSNSSMLPAQAKLGQDNHLSSMSNEEFKQAAGEVELSRLSRISIPRENVSTQQIRNRRASASIVLQYQHYSKLSRQEMQAIQQELDKQINHAERLAKDENMPGRRLSLCQP